MLLLCKMAHRFGFYSDWGEREWETLETGENE